MGQHEKALAIYVTVLGDTEKAIQYCENVYNRGGVGSDMVSNIVIRMCFDSTFLKMIVLFLGVRTFITITIESTR